MRVWVGLALLLAGIGAAVLHFQAPQEPAAIEQIVLAYKDDRALGAGSAAVRGAGGFASQKLSRSATGAKGEDLTTAAPWERRTIVVGSVHAPDAGAAGEQLSGGELARALQSELQRVGCYQGAIDGDWGPKSKRAMSSFTNRTNASLPTEQPDHILLRTVQGYTGQACGSCGPGEGLDDSDRCVPTAVLANNNPTEGNSTDPVQRSEPLPGRMTVGAPTDDVGAYVPLTREAAPSNTDQSSPPRVIRRPRVADQSSTRRSAAPEAGPSHWTRTIFEDIANRH